MNPVSSQQVGGKVVYSVGQTTITQEDRDSISIFRFSGTCSPDLVVWLPQALREVKKGAALHFLEFAAMDDAFVQELLKMGRDLMRRKRQVVLLSPSLELMGILDQLGAADHLPILSGEAALLPGVSIAQSVLKERAALSDIATRFEANPLWRRFDQEAAWLCPHLRGWSRRGKAQQRDASRDAGASRGAEASRGDVCGVARGPACAVAGDDPGFIPFGREPS